MRRSPPGTTRRRGELVAQRDPRAARTPDRRAADLDVEAPRRPPARPGSRRCRPRSTARRRRSLAPRSPLQAGRHSSGPSSGHRRRHGRPRSRSSRRRLAPAIAGIQGHRAVATRKAVADVRTSAALARSSSASAASSGPDALANRPGEVEDPRRVTIARTRRARGWSDPSGGGPTSQAAPRPASAVAARRRGGDVCVVRRPRASASSNPPAPRRWPPASATIARRSWAGHSSTLASAAASPPRPHPSTRSASGLPSVGRATASTNGSVSAGPAAAKYPPNTGQAGEKPRRPCRSPRRRSTAATTCRAAMSTRPRP